MSVPNIFLLSLLKWCSILVRLFLIILYFVAVIHFIEYFYFIHVVLIVFGNTWKIIYFGSTKGNTIKCERLKKVEKIRQTRELGIQGKTWKCVLWVFFLLHMSQTWSWRNHPPRNANRCRYNTLQNKPALISRRTDKGAASQTKNKTKKSEKKTIKQ